MVTYKFWVKVVLLANFQFATSILFTRSERCIPIKLLSPINYWYSVLLDALFNERLPCYLHTLVDPRFHAVIRVSPLSHVTEQY